jgi:hypothetical protein
MSQLIDRWPGRLLALFLPLVLMFALLLPGQALAKKLVGVEGGGNGGGGSEGDPLDSNDYGGDGSDDEYEQSGAGDASSGWLFLPILDLKILLVPEYEGGTLNFRVIVIQEEASSLEEYHAP